MYVLYNKLVCNLLPLFARGKLSTRSISCGISEVSKVVPKLDDKTNLSYSLFDIWFIGKISNIASMNNYFYGSCPSFKFEHQDFQYVGLWNEVSDYFPLQNGLDLPMHKWTFLSACKVDNR